MKEGIELPGEKRVKPRVALLDILRGIALVNMIAFHTLFDLVYIFGMDVPWYSQWQGYIWQQAICWTFILVSGAAMQYGRSAVRRGILVFGCGLLLSLVTALVMPDQLVVFGILHFLGLGMILAGLLRPVLDKIPPLAGAAGCFLLFVVLRGVPAGFIGVLDLPLAYLPSSWYGSAFLFPLGLPRYDFYSSDYFPLIPWFFLFLTGFFVWGCLKDRVKTALPGKNHLGWMGRHSLTIYLLHQPVAYGLLLLLRAIGLL